MHPSLPGHPSVLVCRHQPMPKKINLDALISSSRADIAHAMKRYREVSRKLDHFETRWVAQMTAVEVHATWERYAEKRLITALNHYPSHFLLAKKITGVKRISAGFASYLVRDGKNFFDFRSTGELIGIGKRLVGSEHNPFESLNKEQRRYLDCLTAIRNMVVHRSDAAELAYKKALADVYRISSAPGPPEFLHSIDYRYDSPKRGDHRLASFSAIAIDAVETTAK
jgi:hypothetical protein